MSSELHGIVDYGEVQPKVMRRLVQGRQDERMRWWGSYARTRKRLAGDTRTAQAIADKFYADKELMEWYWADEQAEFRQRIWLYINPMNADEGRGKWSITRWWQHTDLPRVRRSSYARAQDMLDHLADIAIWDEGHVC